MAHATLSPVGWHGSVGVCGVRAIEVEVICMLQSWECVAITECGDRCVVARCGQLVVFVIAFLIYIIESRKCSVG